MRLTQETDYALRLVLTFAQLEPGLLLTTKELSENQNIPYRFLLRLIRKLKHAKILASRQGVDGGFCLARPPAEISFMDVIKAIEGDISITHCLKSTALCNIGAAPECKVHRALGAVQENLIQSLQSRNFANI